MLPFGSSSAAWTFDGTKAGQQLAVCQKMRVLQRRDFTIGGYTPAGRNFDAILIGDDEGRSLQYVAKVRDWFHAGHEVCSLQAVRWNRDEALPVQELPEARRGLTIITILLVSGRSRAVVITTRKKFNRDPTN